MKLFTRPNPVGPENNSYILKHVRNCETVVLAWGTNGEFMKRGGEVVAMLRANGVKPKYLKLTKGGHPRHPLYLKGDLVPVYFPVPR